MEQVLSPTVTVDVQLHITPTVPSPARAVRCRDTTYPQYCPPVRSTQTVGKNFASTWIIFTCRVSTDSTLLYCYFEDNSSAEHQLHIWGEQSLWNGRTKWCDLCSASQDILILISQPSRLIYWLLQFGLRYLFCISLFSEILWNFIIDFQVIQRVCTKSHTFA